MNFNRGEIAILVYEFITSPRYVGQEVLVLGPSIWTTGSLLIGTGDGKVWQAWPFQLKKRDDPRTDIEMSLYSHRLADRESEHSRKDGDIAPPNQRRQ